MHIVDRRLNPGKRSLENRQRFLRRAKAIVVQAVRKSSQSRGIPGIMEGGEIEIPPEGISEPRFRRSGGVGDAVLPGNREFIEGDMLPRPPAGGGRGRDAGEGDGEDAFRFVLSREEFLNLFLDDLELPELAKRKLADAEQAGLRRAGYTVSGSPTNISVGRTMRLAMARRVALRRPRADTIEDLRAELAETDDEERGAALTAEIASLGAKMRRIPYIDPIDVRYRRFEVVKKPAAQAVMFCLMDVSGSMSEHMKDLAKRFYTLLYVFLTRRYRYVEIVFVRHTDHAEEVDEDTFFHSPATGGTLVSSALEEMRRIVAERYRPSDWNIYVAQASDGDNSYSDGATAARLLKEAILPITQYFAYLEVAEEGDASIASRSASALWSTYDRVRGEGAAISMRKVSHRSEIFPVFRDLFARRGVQEKAV